MKFTSFGLCVLSLLFVLCIGCSSSKSPATISPLADDTPIMNPVGTGHEIMASGTFEIDLENMEIRDITDRSTALHYNITGFLSGYFKYFIVSWQLPYVTLRLEITNPTALQVYDVRIIYTNLYGKEVLNPDGYTNFLDPAGDPDFNPFHYFAKEYPNQAFPVGPGGVDSEILELYWPTGASTWVTYVIECSLGGNAAEPYKIRDIETEGIITPIGGGMKVMCTVDDWQGDITSVTMLANDIYDEDQIIYRYLDTNTFIGSIVNLGEVTPGEYTVWLKAKSPNPNNICLWMPFVITVEDTDNMAPKFLMLPESYPNHVAQGVFPRFTGHASDPEWVDSNFLWNQISPTDPVGAFWSTGSDLSEVRWHPPLVENDTEFLFELKVDDGTVANTSYAILALNNSKPLPPVITEGPTAYPSPVSEGQELTLSVVAIDPNFPEDPHQSFGYFWDTVSPSGPSGEWDNSDSNFHRECVWYAPEVDEDTEFTFSVVISKPRTDPPVETEAEVTCLVRNMD